MYETQVYFFGGSNKGGSVRNIYKIDINYNKNYEAYWILHFIEIYKLKEDE